MGQPPKGRQGKTVAWVLFFGIFGGGALGALAGCLDPHSREFDDLAVWLGAFAGAALGLVGSLVGLLVAWVVRRTRVRAG